ncbi:hypothetical protein [Nitrospirillum pindoramense]|uniref:hypothetical protein n=1 Tax=Nitrospirillum amazonense TaxID=28077 RepID=UPI0011A9734D|nr:hypothetical protein [Nitrospirillum amazonense]
MLNLLKRGGAAAARQWRLCALSIWISLRRGPAALRRCYPLFLAGWLILATQGLTSVHLKLLGQPQSQVWQDWHVAFLWVFKDLGLSLVGLAAMRGVLGGRSNRIVGFALWFFVLTELEMFVVDPGLDWLGDYLGDGLAQVFKSYLRPVDLRAWPELAWLGLTTFVSLYVTGRFALVFPCLAIGRVRVRGWRATLLEIWALSRGRALALGLMPFVVALPLLPPHLQLNRWADGDSLTGITSLGMLLDAGIEAVIQGMGSAVVATALLIRLRERRDERKRPGDVPGHDPLLR